MHLLLTADKFTLSFMCGMQLYLLHCFVFLLPTLINHSFTCNKVKCICYFTGANFVNYEGKSNIIRTLVFPIYLHKCRPAQVRHFVHSLLPFQCTWSSGPQACIFPPRRRFLVGCATIYVPLPTLLCP